ncbi:hypothetical protein ACJIZ3_003146 [Penstemon smallii]|uniref:Uncharacterized protein n=1 Tax=Penstemon smallii TaxID=265156 RepID=A0ABD3UBA9_9LAMI
MSKNSSIVYHNKRKTKRADINLKSQVNTRSISYTVFCYLQK